MAEAEWGREVVERILGMKKERYISALRKRVYALVEQGVITAGAGSVILTSGEKRYERVAHGFSVEKLPRLNPNA